ncbi:MAG TPA: hypothetical protein PLQ89_21840, partial [Phycisphaerae bacterium]|nr:hypothetical protein [Phycisphaerae bacterium]
SKATLASATEKSGCCSGKDTPAADSGEKKCCKEDAKLAAATQPANGQSKCCSKSETSLVSASDAQSTTAQPVAQ